MATKLLSKPGVAKTEGGKKLLEAIRGHQISTMWGVRITRFPVIPGQTCFVANAGEIGPQLEMADQLFHEGIQELRGLGWLKEPVQCGGCDVYKVGDLVTRS